MDKRKYQGPEKTPHEIIEILPDAEQRKALLFIDLGLELKCKVQTRYSNIIAQSCRT